MPSIPAHPLEFPPCLSLRNYPDRRRHGSPSLHPKIDHRRRRLSRCAHPSSRRSFAAVFPFDRSTIEQLGPSHSRRRTRSFSSADRRLAGTTERTRGGHAARVDEKRQESRVREKPRVRVCSSWVRLCADACSRDVQEQSGEAERRGRGGGGL